MVNKKVKASAFSVFMHEFISKERKHGRTYPSEDWAKVVAPYWKELDVEEREWYKERAKSEPERRKFVPASKCKSKNPTTKNKKKKKKPPKYTSQGVLIADIERHRQEQQDFTRYMEKRVKSMVESGFEKGDITTMPMYFFMANYFYKTFEGLYAPAEIAICKFTFLDGIDGKFYHTFVNPGVIEMGYSFEAREHSEETHQLPVPGPECMGEMDFDKIYASILDFLDIQAEDLFEKEDIRKPCVFALKSDMPMLHSVLDQLSFKEWSKGQRFDLFHLELLFNELKNSVTKLEKERVSITNYWLYQDKYAVVPNISCDFHEPKDSFKHCALSHVRRWFFLFADHISKHINAPLIPGKHIPAHVVSFDETNAQHGTPWNGDKEKPNDDVENQNILSDDGLDDSDADTGAETDSDDD